MQVWRCPLPCVFAFRAERVDILHSSVRIVPPQTTLLQHLPGHPTTTIVATATSLLGVAILIQRIIEAGTTTTRLPLPMRSMKLPATSRIHSIVIMLDDPQ